MEDNPFLGGESNLWKQVYWKETHREDCKTGDYFIPSGGHRIIFKYNGQVRINYGYYNNTRMQPPSPYLYGIYNFSEDTNEFWIDILIDNDIPDDIDFSGYYEIQDSETIILKDFFLGDPDFHENDEFEPACGHILKLERISYD
jgi:hypothetical protein